jgi:hypothetical protein
MLVLEPLLSSEESNYKEREIYPLVNSSEQGNYNCSWLQ